MEAKGAALTHAILPDSYWDFVMMDATYKYNCMPHSSTWELSMKLWSPNASIPPYFYPFGTLGSIPNRQSNKSKLKSRAIPVRFLYHLPATTIILKRTDKGTIIQNRFIDFNPINPALNTVAMVITINQSTGKIKSKNRKSLLPIPSKITNTTTAPITTHHATRYPDSQKWGRHMI